MNKLGTVVFVSLAAAAACLGAARVRAQTAESSAPDVAQAHPDTPDEPEERARFREAMRLFHERRYDEVLPILQALQSTSSEPLYLFNLGQTYRQLGDCTSALDAYQRYLAAPLPDPAPHRQAARDSAREYVRTLEPCARRAEPVDGEPAAAALARPAPVPAPPAAAATAPEVAPWSSPALWTSSLLLGAGAAAAVAASYWGVRAHRLESSLEERYGGETPAPWDAQAEQDFTDGDRYARRARWVGSAAALSVAAGGLVLLLTRRERERPKQNLSLLPGRQGAEALWTTSF